MREKDERQTQLLMRLRTQKGAVTGSDLATLCQVTRQVVVHDIAILRAAGYPILSTPRGYLLDELVSTHKRAILSVCHPPSQAAEELYCLVDCGVHVLDVVVEHPLYGELKGGLHLSSRRDIDFFLKQIQPGVGLLSSLTDGHHLHTVEYSELAALEEAIQKLRALGITVMDL
jgi:uncharacterized protein